MTEGAKIAHADLRRLYRAHVVTMILLSETTELEKCAEQTSGRFDCEYKVVEKLVHLETDIKLLREQQQSLETKNAELMSMVEEQTKEIANLKKNEGIKTVFANVYLPGTKTFAVNQRLIYTNVIANVGNAYSTHHGYFEAPREGTYLFTAQLCTNSNSHVVIQLKQDGHVLNEVVSGEPQWPSCGSCTAITYMTVGSKVWVHISYSHHGVIRDQFGRPSFTGVLINTYPKI